MSDEFRKSQLEYLSGETATAPVYGTEYEYLGLGNMRLSVRINDDEVENIQITDKLLAENFVIPEKEPFFVFDDHSFELYINKTFLLKDRDVIEYVILCESSLGFTNEIIIHQEEMGTNIARYGIHNVYLGEKLLITYDNGDKVSSLGDN